MNGRRRVFLTATGAPLTLIAIGAGTALAAMVSDGGGAEFVSEDEAWTAIRRDEKIVINDDRSLTKWVDIPLEKEPANRPPRYSVVPAYREAGMFVTYLRELDGPGFDHMMNAILGGRPFGEAVSVGYNDNANSLWRKFVKAN